jgi:hypothetical protein
VAVFSPSLLSTKNAEHGILDSDAGCHIIDMEQRRTRQQPTENSMRPSLLNGFVLLLVAFCAGVLCSNLTRASALTESRTANLSERHFIVSIAEIQQGFVFADEFTQHYAKKVALSDGSIRDVQLTPMVHEDMQVIEC